MKRFINNFILVLILMLSLSKSVIGADLIVSIDGVEQNLPGEIVEAKIFVSIDYFKIFGLDYQINNKIITLKNSNVEFTFTIDSNQVKVNDLSLTLDTEVYKKENKVYLPLQFVLETLNYTLSWDTEANKIDAIKQTEPKFPLIIRDGGNKYIVEKQAETIVSLAPGVTEKLFALGVGDRIKGRTSYCNYPAEVNDIENIGTLYEPNLELILDISPDLVIAETHFKQEILDKLKEAGINYIAKSTAQSIEEVYNYMLTLGAIVGKNYEARALVASLKSKVERVKFLFKDLAEEEKPSVYYVIGTGQYGEYTAGRNTFIGELITIAGAKNVADDVEGWQYSLEKLIEHNPDYIIGEQFNIDIMLHGDNYQALSAIKNNKYLIVNDDIFSRAAPRAINEGLKILVGFFHKDKLEDLHF